MARIWDRTPEFTSNAGDFTFGFEFSADVAITAEGVWWYQATGGPSTVTARLYNASGSTVLASGTNSSLSLGWNLVAFSSPYAANAATTYVAAVEVTDVHGYDSAGLPKTSPDGHVTIPTNGGRYEGGHVGFPDANSWSGLHGIDLEYEVAAGEVASTGLGAAAAYGIGIGTKTAASVGAGIGAGYGSGAGLKAAAGAGTAHGATVGVGAGDKAAPGLGVAVAAAYGAGAGSKVVASGGSLYAAARGTSGAAAATARGPIVVTTSARSRATVNTRTQTVRLEVSAR